jgi:hypothetical protein
VFIEIRPDDTPPARSTSAAGMSIISSFTPDAIYIAKSQLDAENLARAQIA